MHKIALLIRAKKKKEKKIVYCIVADCSTRATARGFEPRSKSRWLKKSFNWSFDITRVYLRGRAARSALVRCWGINNHILCVCIQSAFSKPPPVLVILFTAWRSSGELSMNAGPSVGNRLHSAKGIKLLSIFGIPGRRRRRRYVYGRSIYSSYRQFV